MPAWNSFSYAFGPLVAVLLIGLFIVILRWAFSLGSSVVAAAPRPGSMDDDGPRIMVWPQDEVRAREVLAVSD